LIEKVYTVEQAAELLLVAPYTIRKWLREGKLRGVRAGRMWRVRDSDIQEYLDKNAT